MKVVHALGVSGEVETVRGRNGGMRLAKSAASINLGSIVRRTEADMVLVPCFDDTELCTIGGTCKLRAALGDALAAFSGGA
jgi:Rrf2 family nitric oxide-sensitive transcriptional repressor